MKFLVLYCNWYFKKVLLEAEILEEKSIEKAIEKTDRNLEMNVVIPLTKRNKKILKELVK